MKFLLSALILLLPTYAAITAIGATGTLDRARKLQERVAVPGHDDGQGWSSSLDLGASLTRGNSETLLVTASLTLDLDFGQNEFFGNFTYAYGEDSGDITEDEFILMASLSRLITEDGFWYWGGRIDGQHDELADIQYRYTGTAFFGHYFVKRPDDSLQFSVELGAGISTEEQGEVKNTFGVAYIGQRFNYWITDFTRLYQGLAVFSEIGKFSDLQAIAEVGIETFLSDSLSFKAYVQNQYESEPAPGRKENDLRIVTGLSYKF